MTERLGETVQCVGPMIHGWFAELRFAPKLTAAIRDHDKAGEPLVARVPIGAYRPATDEDDEALSPDDDMNRNLMAILAAPRMVSALRFCQKYLSPREDREEADIPSSDDWREDSEMLREVEDVLESLDVPSWDT